MDIKFLSEKFYAEFQDCKEILKKEDRPYLVLVIECDGIDYAIPFRTNINHNLSFICSEDPEYRGGLDYTKAIPILEDYYIKQLDKEIKIKQNEFNYLKSKEEKLKKGFKKYLKEFRKATLNSDQKRYEKILKYSSLQYFKDRLQIE